MIKHKFLLWKILGLMFIIFLGFFAAGIWRAMHPGPATNLQGTWTTFKPATAESPVVTIMFAKNLAGYEYALKNRNYMASPFNYQVKDDTTLTVTDKSGSHDVAVQMPDIDTLILNLNGHDVTFKRSKYDYGYLDTRY